MGTGLTETLKRVAPTAACALILCVLATGCKPRDPAEDPGKSPETASQATDAVGRNADSQGDAQSSRDGALSDAARLLGDATSQFAGVFSDSDDSAAGEEGGFDISLVDEKTRSQYEADRTLVAPTLAQRSAEVEDAPKIKLQYRFEPQTNMTCTVTHLVRKRTSYGGKESLIETSSTTTRRWEFLDRLEDGRVQARHWIDHMILRQDDHEKAPVDYDSDRDVVVPPEISAFGTEKAVGVVLETFCINSCGVMSDKTKLVAEYNGREGDSNVMAPFPEGELAVGDVWTIPYALFLKGSDGLTRPYQAVERFRLESADDKYATITFETTLLSIVDDPVIEGALAERLFTGRALFDRELGQTVRTELNFKKSVAGAFGFSSFLDYDCRVVEKLDSVDVPRETNETNAEQGDAAPGEPAEPAADAPETLPASDAE